MLVPIYNRQVFYIFLIFLIIFSVPIFALATHCTVSKISIIPGLWENTNTKTSYIIQSQDSNSESCHTQETLRLSFESNTEGSFTGQTGNPIQLWISSNSANRNFYHNHEVSENYVLTVRAGYGSADDWDTLFTASLPSTSGVPQEEISQNTSGDTYVSDNNISNIPSSSTHYDSSSFNLVTPKVTKLFGAGRDRLGSVGSPLEFQVEASSNYDRHHIFKWNFGDGNEGSGDTVTHTYEYAGDYVVMLNISFPGGKTISRINVKIVEPNITVTEADSERIELKNNSKYEISLFGRVLMAGQRSFVFPQDTIMKAGQSISFSSKLTKLSPLDSHDAIILSVGESARQNTVFTRIEEEKLKKIKQIKVEIASLQVELAKSYNNQNSLYIKETVNSLEQATNTIAVAAVVKAISLQNTNNIGSWLKVIKQFLLRSQ